MNIYIYIYIKTYTQSADCNQINDEICGDSSPTTSETCGRDCVAIASCFQVFSDTHTHTHAAIQSQE